MEFDDYLGLVDFATPCGLVCKLCGGGFQANMKCLALRIFHFFGAFSTRDRRI